MQDPAARCGKCEACRYVESTKKIVLASSAPAGKGIGDPEAELWNNALRTSPCSSPLVWVYMRDGRTLKGRIVHDDPQWARLDVQTAEDGLVQVDRHQLKPWQSRDVFEGISFELLLQGLGHLPRTWYGQILETLVKQAYKQDIFQPGGALRIVLALEQQLNARSSFVRTQVHAERLAELCGDVLRVPHLHPNEPLELLARQVLEVLQHINEDS